MRSNATNRLPSFKSTTGSAGRKAGISRHWAWKTSGIFTFLAMLAGPVGFLFAREDRPAQAVQCLGCKEPPTATEKSGAEAPHSVDEIELEHCDRLPMVKVQFDGTEKYLLLDTAATSILNRKSFCSTMSKE